MNISGAANAGASAGGSLTSSHIQTSSSSRPASVMAYTVRSGRRPSRFTSTGSVKPRSAQRPTAAGLGKAVHGTLGPPAFPVHVDRLDEAALGQARHRVVDRRLPDLEGPVVSPLAHPRAHLV